jgi:hypothetical protein
MKLMRLMPLIVTAAMMAGCGGAGSLPTGTGASCGTPAGGTFQGGQNLGGYWGQTLPGTFAKLTSESSVDAAITQQSQTSSWTCFQQFYPGAVAKWKENTGRK